jgi:hypothetical protein
MTDIIGRLRSEAVNWSATCGDLFGEAADEIERLQEGRDTMGNLWAREKLARFKADVENERLRASLRKIADLDFRGPRPEGSVIAYRALEK